jgi:Arc/MetJ-type ribon-helix-helix transcriptional regulator
VQKVPRPKGPNDTPLSVNIPGEWSEEVERLVETMAQPGMAVTRSDIIRMALRRGLDALKTEHPEPRRSKR